MIRVATSAWVAIGPALIAGGIGLASALLSFIGAQRSLSRAERTARESRAHERDLLIWVRRLDAAETVWKLVFDLERVPEMTDDVRDQLIRSVVWLPPDTGRDVLALLVAFQKEPIGQHPEALEEVRQSLLAVATTTPLEAVR